MTAKERVLAVWPDTVVYWNNFLLRWLWYRKSGPDKVSSQSETEEAAWQNAAESLPQPAQDEEQDLDEMCNCGHSAEYHSGGYGDCMTGSGCDCRGFNSDPVVEPLPIEANDKKPTLDMNTDQTLDYLRNVSHDDLDDAYAGPCPKCGGKQIYDRSAPRHKRPLQCLNTECEYGPPAEPKPTLSTSEPGHSWKHISIWGRGDIIGVRDLMNGQREFLMHNEALCHPFYIAVEGKPQPDSSSISSEPTRDRWTLVYHSSKRHPDDYIISGRQTVYLIDELRAMTIDRDLWQSDHNEDCPNADAVETMKTLHREIIDKGRKVLNSTCDEGMSQTDFIEWALERLERR